MRVRECGDKFLRERLDATTMMSIEDHHGVPPGLSVLRFSLRDRVLDGLREFREELLERLAPQCDIRGRVRDDEALQALRMSPDDELRR